jgi:hypothetical protein
VADMATDFGQGIDDIFVNPIYCGSNWHGLVSVYSDMSPRGRCHFFITDTELYNSVEGYETLSLASCLDDGPLIGGAVRSASVVNQIEGPEFNSAAGHARNWEDGLQVQTVGASNGFRGMEMGDISTGMLM